MHARTERPTPCDPDRDGWWTIRFTWPGQQEGARPSVTYAMRPSRAAAVNCAASLLYRGRTRGLHVVCPMRADIKGPSTDAWCPVVAPPGLRGVGGRRHGAAPLDPGR